MKLYQEGFIQIKIKQIRSAQHAFFVNGKEKMKVGNYNLVSKIPPVQDLCTILKLKGLMSAGSNTLSSNYRLKLFFLKTTTTST